MATPLLKTKLYIPSVRPELVSRPRLIERLDEGLCLGRRLTLIAAPAGFGKTTLLSEWIHCRGAVTAPLQVAWFSLDENDNDPARFLAYLVAALQTVEPDVGAGVLTALQSPQPPPVEAVLVAVINDIAAAAQGGDHKGRPYVLVLDDYHLVTARPIHDAVAFLLDHLPSNLHLVIVTRADPPLPLARLRARGQLTELRQTDLRFTSQEAAAFLNQVMGLDLADKDVATLKARTEGWIAGLQMAALSIQGQEDVAAFIRALTGSDRYILDYLVEEVLKQQPEPVQTFLLQTSILDRLTGTLCDAVWDKLPTCPTAGDGQAMLEQLERDNLFIVPLDNERRWYRYHRLFADLLRYHLHQAQPDLAPTLHHRASEWYEQNRLMAEAVDHALAAGDFERAARLIEQVAEAALMRSELTTFLGWVDALPDGLVRDRPSLCLFQAWAFLMSGRPLESIESRLQDAAHSETMDKTASLRALIALYQGQMSRAAELARQALEQLSEQDTFLRGLATWVLGLSRLVDGDLAAGAQALDQVARMSRRAGNVMISVMVLCNVAELRMQQGRLRQAKETYQQALEWATDEQGGRLPIAGEALMGLGRLLYQWNDLEAATRHLAEGIELTQRWGEIGAMDGYLSLAQVRQAQGDADGAQEAIRRARQLALRTDTTELDDILVAAHQAQLWLAQGDLDAALRWLEERGLTLSVALAELEERLGDDFFRSRRRRTIEYVTLVRVLLAQGRPDEALAVLDLLLAIAERWGLNERVIRFQILRALAFRAQGNVAQAMTALQRALTLAEPGGYVRIFLDEGETVARLLYRAVERGIAPEYAGQLLAAFPAPEAKPHAEMVEPLSERELDVLRLIAEGLSNQEIARRLHLSLSTVKWHTGNIYGKLGVKNRTQAVAKARSLGILV